MQQTIVCGFANLSATKKKKQQNYKITSTTYDHCTFSLFVNENPEKIAIVTITLIHIWQNGCSKSMFYCFFKAFYVT